MAEELNVTSMLIEGFDARKLAPEEQYDKDWQQVVGARQNDKILQSEIVGIENIGSKECAVVHVGKIKGYIPMEFTGVENLRQLRALTGKKVAFKVLEYIEDAEKQIFMASRTAALEEMAEITLRRIKTGDEIVAVVRTVSPNLVRADIGGIEVRLPLDQIRYGWIDDLTEEVKPGDHLRVKVLDIDTEKKEVRVSAKALMKNPWEDCKARYKRGAEYVGTVSGVREFGVFVNLEAGVDSLASHLKYQNLQRGDRVLVRIIGIDEKEQQIRAKIVRVVY
ncbi:S1 RNA-binding domain-containing protein [Heyndrickxia sporothermodurans]|uniref:30S ribosomal protein S1 n=2 Tax=Siminovitchia TaxID=2837510 RepID=A0A429X1Q6_SIMTE|nr:MULTISPECIES: S1 RNA-binding domain-containing protein [Bacillaceae]MBM7716033.1 small subunit ribosomal protein S1 [Siminovitchia thermophila]MEB6549260.1 S1 RNA-binding domain-containing protein [Heyndrickxia sporothermodurans]RST57396.1 30S ribosomal protein S1 [Siminovitchia terrae]